MFGYLLQVRLIPNWELLWQNFYRPDALPVTKPTVSKHWRMTVFLTGDSMLPSQVRNTVIVAWAALPSGASHHNWSTLSYIVLDTGGNYGTHILLRRCTDERSKLMSQGQTQHHKVKFNVTRSNSLSQNQLIIQISPHTMHQSFKGTAALYT